MTSLLRSGLVLLGLIAFTRLAAADEAFTFESVQERARALAAKPYVEPTSQLPQWMQALNYDQHRDIRYARNHTWWRKEKLPFELQFFHPGWLFKTPVKIHEVVGGKAKQIEFSKSLFDYGKQKVGDIPRDTGFAGFRVHHDLNNPGDELAVFLGASYFRAIGRAMHYGLSARGLALNAGEPVPEEFPRFSEFWIVKPAAGAATVTLFALLDSPSVSGAYRFVIQPGDETVMEIKSTLYFRTIPAVVGLAPLTSMFEHGENTNWSRDDFRPEVHDSDGLLLNTGTGEWIWRPLTNPAHTRVSTFADKTPRGFGLLQRDRSFEHYDDLEAHYHERPNAWVEPIGDWGQGVVRLLEITTPDETHDNIVVCWVPAKLPAVGEPLTYEYRLRWYTTNGGVRPPSGYVASTRFGAVLDHADRRRVVVDFAGLPMDQAKFEPELDLTVGAGATLAAKPVVQKIPPMGTWRAAFELVPDGSGKPVELRCFLRNGKDVVTETWSNLWSP